MKGGFGNFEPHDEGNDNAIEVTLFVWSNGA